MDLHEALHGVGLPRCFRSTSVRGAPIHVLSDLSRMAAWQAGRGWHLHTGGASVADMTFAEGATAKRRSLYLPWKRLKGLLGPDCHVLRGDQYEACARVASEAHPARDRCKPAVRKRHACNAAILLTPSCGRPVKAIVCRTPDGKTVGGTGVGIRIAERYGFPVFNLALMPPKEVCEGLLGLAGW